MAFMKLNIHSGLRDMSWESNKKITGLSWYVAAEKWREKRPSMREHFRGRVAVEHQSWRPLLSLAQLRVEFGETRAQLIFAFVVETQLGPIT